MRTNPPINKASYSFLFGREDGGDVRLCLSWSDALSGNACYERAMNLRERWSFFITVLCSLSSVNLAPSGPESGARFPVLPSVQTSQTGRRLRESVPVQMPGRHDRGRANPTRPANVQPPEGPHLRAGPASFQPDAPRPPPRAQAAPAPDPTLAVPALRSRRRQTPRRVPRPPPRSRALLPPG